MVKQEADIGIAEPARHIATSTWARARPTASLTLADFHAGSLVDSDNSFADMQARLGRNLQKARLASGLTQQDLSLLAGVDPGLIADVESGCGNPDFYALAALARAVGCSAFELL